MAFITYPTTFGTLTSATLNMIDTNFGQVNTKFSQVQKVTTAGTGQTAQNAIPICGATDGSIQGFGRIQLGGARSASGYFGNITQYLHILSFGAPQNTENIVQMMCPSKLIAIQWIATITQNTANFYTTIQLRINGTNASMSYSFAPGITGTFSAYSPANFNAGDLINWQISTQTGTGFVSMPQLSVWCSV